MNPVVLAAIAGAAFFLLGKKKKQAIEVAPATGDLPAPAQPAPGQAVPAPPPFPGRERDLEEAQAIAAHAVWYGSEGTEPSSFGGHQRVVGQTTDNWLTSYALWSTYDDAPAKIPAGWQTVAGWQPWVDAWKRINVTITNLLEAAGPHWEE